MEGCFLKYYIRLASIMSIVILLSACGRQSIKGNETSTAVVPVMWKTEGFAVNDEVIEEQELWVDRHVRWEHANVQWDEETEDVFGTSEAKIVENCIYRFYPIIQKEEAVPIRGIMERLDTMSMEESVIIYTPEQMGIEDDNKGVIVDFDVISKDKLAIQLLNYTYNDSEKFIPKINELIHINGNVENKVTNLLPVYLEKGICLEEYDYWLLEGECVCDASGNSYVRSRNSDKLYVLDADGNLIIEYECPENGQLQLPMKTEDGELVYPCYDGRMKKTDILWVDTQNRKVEMLASVNGSIVKLYGLKQNNLYYEDEQGIVRWDIASGERKLIFIFNKNEVQDIYDKQLMLRDNDTPLLRIYGYVNGQFQDWLLTLSKEPVEKADAVHVACITDNVSDRVRNCVGVAARNNPDFSYKYEDGDGMDVSDYYTAVMTQMMSGEGPDILFVSPEDMEMLYAKGLIADLREYISDETLKKVISGVVGLGSRNGTLLGIAPDISADSLMVQEDVWNGESWTIEDIISLIEQGKLSGRVTDGEGLYSSIAALRIILKYIIDDSFVIDWENYESHFDDERFIKLIKCLGKNDYENPDGSKEQLDGSIMQVSLHYMSNVYNYLGQRGNEGWHYVGFPSENGCGNYLWADGMVVVNAATASKEAVSAYLECLLSKEVQDTVNTVGWNDKLPILPLSLEDIYYEDYDNMGATYHNYVVVEFADGSTSVHESRDFLEKCVPAPKRYDVVQDIIWEEIQSYYSGDKTADEVAVLIDDRVQLYLDELQ